MIAWLVIALIVQLALAWTMGVFDGKFPKHVAHGLILLSAVMGGLISQVIFGRFTPNDFLLTVAFSTISFLFAMRYLIRHLLINRISVDEKPKRHAAYSIDDGDYPFEVIEDEQPDQKRSAKDYPWHE